MDASCWRKSAAALLVTGILLALGCARHDSAGYQGYLEGEFVYVAAPLGGQLARLAVQKGARVEAGAPLFTLEQSAELSALREATGRLRHPQPLPPVLQKSHRPPPLTPPNHQPP